MLTAFVDICSLFGPYNTFWHFIYVLKGIVPYLSDLIFLSVMVGNGWMKISACEIIKECRKEEARKNEKMTG